MLRRRCLDRSNLLGLYKQITVFKYTIFAVEKSYTIAVPSGWLTGIHAMTSVIAIIRILSKSDAIASPNIILEANIRHSSCVWAFYGHSLVGHTLLSLQ